MSARSRIVPLLGIAVVVLLVAIFTRFSLPASEDPRIVANDMTRAAGRVVGGELEVSLEAREGEWLPEGPEGAVRRVSAFAVAGARLQVPGPLIRVPTGTRVTVHVRNALDRTLTVYGLGERRGLDGDSATLAAGGTHTFQFVAGEPGLYYYAGRTTEAQPLLFRPWEDSQLNGAIVIDPPGAQPQDRIFMITQHFQLDTTTVSGLDSALLAINGESWPHTARVHARQGDTLVWRWLNVSILPHPMHLHGFYYRVDGKGNGATFTSYPEAERPTTVTELLHPGETMAMTWQPVRPGNWIMHCHFAGHISNPAQHDADRRYPVAEHAPHGPSAEGPERADAHAAHNMSGLVIGVHVRARGRMPAPPPARALRLLVRSAPEVYGEYAGYGFVLGGSEEEPSGTFRIPGPTLVLERDERVAITIVNQAHEPAAVHWHGIELESYPDGVPGFSGAGRTVLPAIAPGDSLTVRFTPPRAGTFMYHSHFNELHQISAGLYGAIVVLEPGERYDPERDRVLLFSDAGPTIDVIRGPFMPPLLNGAAQPEPMAMVAGATYRLRAINIRSDYLVMMSIRDGEELEQWQAVARDGAVLPAALARTGPAELLFAPGQIYDFEFTPRRAGDLTLRFGQDPDFPPEPPVEVPIRVRAPQLAASR